MPSTTLSRSASLLVGAVLLVCALVVPSTSAADASDSHSHASDGRPGTATAQVQRPRLKPIGRVTRHGSALYLDDHRWRASGVNMYWLGLDDNIQDAQGPTYPTHAAVDNGFASAAALGAKLVRATTLGVSVGSPRSLEPTLDHFNDRAFAPIDYAVADARRYGIHLMIPLTDEWHYYHGGKHTFTNWYGHRDIPGATCVTSNVQRAREAYFYTGVHVIGAFHRYIAHLLNHVNPLTGIRLGSDPTIAMWETGNELWDAPPSWTEQTARFIHHLAPHTLVADGSAASGKDIAETGVNEPAVDVIDAHFYPTDAGKAVRDSAYAAARGKAYVIGEFPLTGSNLPSWLSTLLRHPAISGGLAWTLLPRIHGTPEPHGDGYTFHYPGATPTESRQDSALRGFLHHA